MIKSKYLTLEEVLFSDTAERHDIINAFEDPTHESNANLLIKNIYDPLCDHYGFEVPITSFYRSGLLNRKIKGSKNSQHCKGQAVDLKLKSSHSVKNSEMFDYIRAYLPFDQLIWEFGNKDEPAWVHVSYSIRNRRQVLRASIEVVKGVKKTVYAPF